MAWKSSVVLLLAWLVAYFLRNRSAAARHLIWTVAAGAVLALPVLSVSMPALRVSTPAVPLSISTVVTAGGSSAGARPSVSPLSGSTVASQPGIDWRTWLMWLWAAGTTAGLLKMLASCAVIWRVRIMARTSSDRELCKSLALSLDVRHSVDLLETEPGSMPMTFGILRPVIFMPSDAAQWSDERRRVVLLHELAHVRRGDVFTHLLARTALSVYWWNPLAWIAWRAFLKERERAADDLVLNAGTRASEYAGHLFEVARTMRFSPTAAVAMARRSQLEGRLAAILDSGVNRKTPGRALAWVAACLALALIVPLAAVRAQDPTSAALSADVDATIRTATSLKNHTMLENAAKAAEGLRQFDTAHKLLKSALAIRAGRDGLQSVDYGMGVLKVADLERRWHGSAAAEQYYTEAAQVLGEKPEAGRALLALGTTALVRKDFPQAIEHLEHAQRVDASQSGLALMWMAVVRQTEQKMVEAESLYQRAVSTQEPKSAEAALIRRVFAQFRRHQGREAEAVDLMTQAGQIQVASALPPAPDRSPGVLRIGGAVKPPTLLQKVEPAYTEEARAAKLVGTVVLYVEVGPDGVARHARVVRELGLGLDEKGLDAISQWRFQPATKDGEPVTVAATIEINFRLL
ncbi:MAG TPA: TonB family protein [Bryobacteraceae bacterium]|nr:TonB family protein [Bryobacteraceae bacterium]